MIPNNTLPSGSLSRAEIETIVGELADLNVEHDSCTNELNQAIVDAKAKHEPKLQKLFSAMSAKAGIIESWARANRSEFGEKQSIELLHGTLQFRNGPPKLQKVSKFTWEKVLNAIKAVKKFADKYVATKEDVNKALILADYKANQIDDKELRQFGCYIDQDEFFSIDNLKPVPAPQP